MRLTEQVGERRTTRMGGLTSRCSGGGGGGQGRGTLNGGGGEEKAAAQARGEWYE